MSTTRPDDGEPNNKKGYLITIVLLALLSIVLGYFLLTSKQTVEVQAESISQLEIDQLQLTNELQDMLIQYDTVTVKNEKLEAEINAQQEQIKDMLKQIERHKDDAYIISKLKKEASTLRQIMKGYLFTIDSLNTLTVDLRSNNEILSKELSEVKTRAQELESETKNLQDIVSTGSVLQAITMTSEAIRVRNNGSQVTINRAKNTEMIKTCAVVGENRITPIGKKTIYLRIISPDGVVLDDASGEGNLFEFNGVSGKYSIRRQIDYEGVQQEVCLFYTVNSELPGGQYIIEMYESGMEIGKTTLDLK